MPYSGDARPPRHSARGVPVGPHTRARRNLAGHAARSRSSGDRRSFSRAARPARPVDAPRRSSTHWSSTHWSSTHSSQRIGMHASPQAPGRASRGPPGASKPSPSGPDRSLPERLLPSLVVARHTPPGLPRRSGGPGGLGGSGGLLRHVDWQSLGAVGEAVAASDRQGCPCRVGRTHLSRHHISCPD